MDVPDVKEGPFGNPNTAEEWSDESESCNGPITAMKIYTDTYDINGIQVRWDRTNSNGRLGCSFTLY
jgi:hypothetical protein